MTTRDGAALGEADTTAARRFKTLEAIQQRVLWLSTLIMHHANQCPVKHKRRQKRGALRQVWVEKFKAQNDRWLVAHTIDVKRDNVYFVAVGQHENFYRNVQQLQEPGNVASASYGSDASQAFGVAVGPAFMAESPLHQRTGDGSSSSDFVN